MVVTTSGKNLIRDWLASQIASGATATVTAPIAIVVGEGSTAPTVSDTAMDSEWTAGSPRKTFEYASGTSARIVEYESYWNSTQASGLDLFEIGVFNSSGASAGSMFARSVLNSVQSFDGSTELLIDYQFEVI